MYIKTLYFILFEGAVLGGLFVYLYYRLRALIVADNNVLAGKINQIAEGQKNIVNFLNSK